MYLNGGYAIRERQSIIKGGLYLELPRRINKTDFSAQPPRLWIKLVRRS